MQQPKARLLAVMQLLKIKTFPKTNKFIAYKSIWKKRPKPCAAEI